MPLRGDTFRRLMDAAPDAILVVTEDNHIARANQRCEMIFGWQAQELIGKPLDVLIPESARPGHHSLVAGYFSASRVRPMGLGMNLRAQRKDGTTIPVEISLSPFEFGEGRAAIAVVRDVSAIREYEKELSRKAEELERSNKELEQFAYIASHDLQEPLRVVAGYIQLLERRFGDKIGEEGIEFIGYAVAGVKRMQCLIEDLLTYSRATTRRGAIADVDLSEVIEVTLANLEVAVKEAGAKVTMQPMPVVRGDISQLRQLFQNLIGNALKFRGEQPPEIEIGCEDLGNEWHLWVRDNGIGIAAEYQDKIFEVFKRLHAHEEYKGTGIGLAICKKIVDRHQGRIWVESQIGKFTTFHLTLSKEIEDEPG